MANGKNHVYMFGICWAVLFKTREKDNNECAICLNPLNKKWTKTKCGHRFHPRCLNGWYKHQRAHSKPISCPMCKTFKYSTVNTKTKS